MCGKCRGERARTKVEVIVATPPEPPLAMEVRSELLVDERPGSWFIHLRLSAQLTCVKVFVVCARGFVVASVARLLSSAARLGG